MLQCARFYSNCVKLTALLCEMLLILPYAPVCCDHLLPLHVHFAALLMLGNSQPRCQCSYSTSVVSRDARGQTAEIKASGVGVVSYV